MIDLEYFIDSHCHMFTMADIPLYKPLQQTVEDKDNIGTYSILSLLFLARLFVNPKKKIEHYQPYISFFESEPEDNVNRVTFQAGEAVSARGDTPAGIRANNMIMTPLIMDFDAGAQVNKLRGQADRLKAAITDKTANGAKVLPFLGIHPGRSSEDIADLLNKYNVKSVSKRGGIDKTNSGDFIGIKLYPPLGFDAYPDDLPSLKEAYLAVYKDFAERGLPITVHCQKSSFKLTPYVDEYTQPQNWELVLADFAAKKYPDLRINLAHFGGEDGIKDSIWFVEKDMDTHDYFEQRFLKQIESGWTSSIIRMLKTYPNTYADLAALDVNDEQAIAAIHWLLYLDSHGMLNKGNMPYKLEDKLLWGSDYPMVLNSDLPNYTKIMKQFVDTFHFKGRTIGKYQYPPRGDDGAQERFIRKLCCDNPNKFLIG